MNGVKESQKNMRKDIQVERDKGDPVDGRTDYKRLKKMTEKEVEQNAKSDPDAPLLTEEELDKFNKVKS